MSAPRIIVAADRLKAAIGSRVLFDDLSLQIAHGRITAILGPNGAGKTTLLRILLGVRRQNGGDVSRTEPLGYVPQRSDTAFAYRVHDMVLMGRARHVGMLGAPSSADHAIAANCLARIGISRLTDRSFDTLSGGERQLVLVARALASEPAAVLLDEPASALDLRHQADILTVMRDLARDDGLAVVFTTHHPQHAAAIADDVILMTGAGAEVGFAADLLNERRLTELYGVPVWRLPMPGGGPGRETFVAQVEPAASAV